MRLLLLLLSSHLVFAQSPVSYVDPFIGTGGHGHTYPGASLPFGGVQLSPDTDDHGWDWCSGYNFRDSSIMGFSHTHLSGTGIADLADILVTPYVGAPRYERGAARSAFRHATEVASPGYYAVTLDDHDIRAELTAGPMTGYHRYTFPASAEAKITLDLTHGIDRDRTWLVERTLDAELRVVDSVTLAGYRMSTGWAHLQPVYFIAKFSKPPAGWGLVNGGVYRRGSELARGRAVQGVFDFRTAAGEAVELAVTISREPFPEGYRAPEPAFDRAANDAKANWANTLGTIEIEADPIIRTTFYTALYHASLAPNQLIDGRGDTLISTFSQWDSYRAAFALNTLLRPGMVDDLLDNLLRAYDKNGYLPVWELWGEEVNCMIGTPSVPIVVEALNKGHDRRRSQLEEAIWATLHTDNPVAPWSRYDRFGYVPTGVGEIFSVSKTLEMAYANACAASLGGRFTPLLGRAEAYREVFDPEIGFFRGRDTSGVWKAEFDPTVTDETSFVEATPWQYLFHVQHDIPALLDLHGGKAGTARKLDKLFSAGPARIDEHILDITGLIGQYAHGNEPSHHVAYLYNYVDQPWRTQEVVRTIGERFYTNAPDGLCGNDDCGQLSAWYVFSALGFYPVHPASATYDLGVPLVKSASIIVPGGRFRIVTEGAGDYVKAAYLNGERLARPLITHAQIMAGGELRFVRSSNPEKGAYSPYKARK